MIIQTTIPIPGNKKKIYFEVSIRHDGNDGGIIDIGLSKRMMFSQESSGLNQHSYVYISDGTIEYGKMKQENTKKYGQEDVVGCYADLEKQIFYFTKNGLVVNSLGCFLRRRNLYHKMIFLYIVKLLQSYT